MIGHLYILYTCIISSDKARESQDEEGTQGMTEHLCIFYTDTIASGRMRMSVDTGRKWGGLSSLFGQSPTC